MLRNICTGRALVENPTYTALIVTHCQWQKPSWIWNREPYPTGTGAISSSLSSSFEDPDGTSAQTLLHQRTLHAFGPFASGAQFPGADKLSWY